MMQSITKKKLKQKKNVSNLITLFFNVMKRREYLVIIVLRNIMMD